MNNQSAALTGRQKATGAAQKTKCRKLGSTLLSTSLLVFSLCVSPLAFASQPATKVQKRIASYLCPMDPEVKTTKPGNCPKCGMALRRASGETSPVAVESAKSDAGARAGSPINLARIPDSTVYDQDGRMLHFYSDLVKGKTVAINFLFTTCTTICPPLAATFRKVQQELGERVGRDVSLISISVDPVTDVPERLKSFASKFNAGPGWTFITGGKPEIDQLLKALGAAVADKIDHTPMVLVGNEAADYWTRTYGLAPASTLVKVITDATARSAETNSSVQVPLPGAAMSAAGAERQLQRRPNRDSATVLSTGSSGSGGEAKTPAETAAAYFPNTVLLTQDKKPVHFFDDLMKGKTVIINFMFTTCMGICPPMTANLLKVQEYLGDRVGKDITMISISVDPIVDTPDALKKYTTNYKIKTGWYFLTGKKADVDLVLRKVGGFVDDKNDHSSLVIIGNVETGEWVKMFAMARPAEIADSVMKIAGSK